MKKTKHQLYKYVLDNVILLNYMKKNYWNYIKSLLTLIYYLKK